MTDESKIINRDEGRQKGTATPFPSTPVNVALAQNFDDAVAEVTAKYFGPKVTKPTEITQGWVLRVEKNSPLEPLGPRYEASKGMIERDDTCTKLWVHVWSKDKDKGVPMNWVHPDVWNEQQLIDLHYIYEAADKTIDKIPVKMGDTVDVMYPWGGDGGWKSKVGVYLGVKGTGIPQTIRPTKEFFKRKAKCEEGREKVIPEETTRRRPPPDIGTETLRRGSSGPHVEALQTLLGNLEVDGKFGPKTRRAVKLYQRANGLKADGIVGDKTRAKLKTAGK